MTNAIIHSASWRLADRTLAIGRRPLIMGIVNVTPDSFSDGGQFFDYEAAVQHGLALARYGADILDVGGESTRPGAVAVSVEEELRRVIPVIQNLASQITLPISVDTSKAEVARQAMAAGAVIINDVTALTDDAAMPAVARATKAGLVLMHMQGTPQTMQINPHYDDVGKEVKAYLETRLAALATDGIEAESIVVDPGIGFGKRQEDNLELLARLPEFLSLGRPVCLGISRKGFINRVLGRTGRVEQGVAGTIAVLLHALSHGAVQIARVHDVAAVRDAFEMFLTLDGSAGDKVKG